MISSCRRGRERVMVPLSKPNTIVGIRSALRLAEPDAVIIHRLRTLVRRLPLDRAVVTAGRVGLIACRIRASTRCCRCHCLIRSILMRELIAVLISPVGVVVGCLRILPVWSLASTRIAIPSTVHAIVVALAFVNAIPGSSCSTVLVLRINPHH